MATVPKKKRFDELTARDYNEFNRIVKFSLDKQGNKKIDPETGKARLKGIAKAARHFGVSRQAIYDWRDKIPLTEVLRVRAEKLKEAAKIEEFEGTEWVITDLPKWNIYWQFDAKMDKMILTQRGRKVKSVIEDGFKILKVDPHDWERPEYSTLWNYQPWYDMTLKVPAIAFHRASALLMCMRIAGRNDILAEYQARKPTKGLKGDPKKKHWYFEESEIETIMQHIEEPDFLVLFTLGVLGGARWSGLAQIRVGNIHYESMIIEVYESKVGASAEKVTAPAILDVVREYITDFNITGKLFPRPYDDYRMMLKKICKDNGIAKEKEIGMHILKHTFVTQSSMHGVSLDTVSDITGTDANTLMQFYFGAGKQKQRAEVLGEEYAIKKWHLYVKEDLVPLFRDRYVAIKNRPRARREKTERKIHRTASIKWGNLEARAKSPKTPPSLRDSAIRALALKAQGKTDEEVKILMKWKEK